MSEGGKGDFDELIVCSLEAWDEVWRRNQFLVEELLARNRRLRVLFVEPVVDVPFELLNRRHPPAGGLRSLRHDGRLFATRPRKLLPRVLAGSVVERHLVARVRDDARRLGFSAPVLWVNDESYAALAEQVPWPTLHDMTDDWLFAAGSPRELARRQSYEASLRVRADVRVAVSARLIESRGSASSIRLIPNSVDVLHFQSPQPRPDDLPPGRYVVYVGTLHEDRIDVALVGELARALAPVSVVLVGPDSLGGEAHDELDRLENCHLLGAPPYAQVPAYYQHADVIVVPHTISDFTESLDPIKAYECLAVGRPTVSTPVAGFRELGPPVEVAARERFVGRVLDVLAEAPLSRPSAPPTWSERAEAFEGALRDAVRKRSPSAPGS